jgi:Ni,Fe-hydrogenase III small subunit
MWQMLKQVAKVGLATESPPQSNDAWRTGADAIQRKILEILGRALTIREVDAGSCNGCELEILTGPVSRHMADALRRTYEAMPEPKLVVAVGDCGCTGGIFGTTYATCGAVANVIDVNVAVPGCPPPPIDILRGILTAVTQRAPASA